MRAPSDPLRRSARDLVDAANEIVPPLPLGEAAALLGDEGVLFVDIREPKELVREGMIPGAFKAPRGLLEFWVDPASAYYRAELDSGRRLVLYCGSAWRSALAARSLYEMGLVDVAHIEGGFTAWRRAGLPVERPT